MSNVKIIFITASLLLTPLLVNADATQSRRYYTWYNPLRIVTATVALGSGFLACKSRMDQRNKWKNLTSEVTGLNKLCNDFIKENRTGVQFSGKLLTPYEAASMVAEQKKLSSSETFVQITSKAQSMFSARAAYDDSKQSNERLFRRSSGVCLFSTGLLGLLNNPWRK